MCEWGAIRGDLPEDNVDESRKGLLAPGADVDSVELMVESQKSVGGFCEDFPSHAPLHQGSTTQRTACGMWHRSRKGTPLVFCR